MKSRTFIIRLFFNVVNIFYKKNVRFFKDLIILFLQTWNQPPTKTPQKKQKKQKPKNQTNSKIITITLIRIPTTPKKKKLNSQNENSQLSTDIMAMISVETKSKPTISNLYIFI